MPSCCATDGDEILNPDEVEVVHLGCCTDGVEVLNEDDVEVALLGCVVDCHVGFTLDAVADSLACCRTL